MVVCRPLIDGHVQATGRSQVHGEDGEEDSLHELRLHKSIDVRPRQRHLSRNKV